MKKFFTALLCIMMVVVTVTNTAFAIDFRNEMMHWSP